MSEAMAFGGIPFIVDASSQYILIAAISYQWKTSSVYKIFRNGRFTEHASHLAVLPLKDNTENCNQTSKHGIYFFQKIQSKLNKILP